MRVRAEVAEPGVFLVPGRLLVEIVRSLPARPRRVRRGPRRHLRDLRRGFVRGGQPAVGRVPGAAGATAAGGTADGGALAAAIGQVTPAASRDDTLPMLTAVNVELAGETMTLAATDRYRLAVRELGWHPAPGFGDAGRVSLLVPARTLSDAAKIMSAGTEVAIMLRPDGDRAGGGTSVAGGGAAEAMIGFDAGERRLTARLLAGSSSGTGRASPTSSAAPPTCPPRPSRRPSGGSRWSPSAAPRCSSRSRRGGSRSGPRPRARRGPRDGAGRLRRRRVGDRLQPALPAGRRHRRDRHPAGHARRGGRPVSLRPVSRRRRRGQPSAAPGGRVRLWFTSPSKPAVITRQPDQDADEQKGPEADFRYLVVPQRVQLSALRVRAGRIRAARDAAPAATGRAGYRADRWSTVPGEQQSSEQPDQHGQNQQRQGGELARPVGRRRPVLHIAGPVARARPVLEAGLEPRLKPGLEPGPGRAHGRAAHPCVPLAGPPGAGRRAGIHGRAGIPGVAG